MINGTLSMNKKAQGQVIKFPSVIPMVLQFLPLCRQSLQLEILTKLTLLVSRSVHNMELCRRERVVPALIGFLDTITDEKLMVRSGQPSELTILKERTLLLIQGLAQHDLRATELKSFFALIRNASEKHSVC